MLRREWSWRLRYLESIQRCRGVERPRRLPDGPAAMSRGDHHQRCRQHVLEAANDTAEFCNPIYRTLLDALNNHVS